MPEIKPTRSELIALKRKVKIAEAGHRLLKKKRDGLIIEFFAVLKKARDLRSRMNQTYREGELLFRRTVALEGFLSIKGVASSIARRPLVSLKVKNIMGVVIPKIDALELQKAFAENLPISTSVRMDSLAEKYTGLLELVISAAETEVALRKILKEIEKTKRRVNALEFAVIPKMKSQASFIRMRLEEVERENIFRMKRIKAAQAG